MAKIDKTCTRTRYKSNRKQTEKQRKKAEHRLKKKQRTKIRNAKRDQKQTYYQDRIDDDNYIPQKGSNDQDVEKHDRKMCWVCRTNDACDILEEQVFESYEQFLDDQYREETNFYSDEISGIDDEKQNQVERLWDEETEYIYFSDYEAFVQYMDEYERQHPCICIGSLGVFSITLRLKTFEYKQS
ncbi:hypothetical protein DPMN_044537 [Dreissena polymorpha]|nr:hypothetical protein DPMN_044537 [Dreissena polymorpha]